MRRGTAYKVQSEQVVVGVRVQVSRITGVNPASDVTKHEDFARKLAASGGEITAGLVGSKRRNLPFSFKHSGAIVHIHS